MNGLHELERAGEKVFFLAPYNDPENRSKWLYNPFNPYNLRTDTGTIIHLTAPDNTLSAEIDIVAQATVIRKNPQGKIITDSSQLINCSKYGNPSRNSDPGVSVYHSILYMHARSITIPIDWRRPQFFSQGRTLDIGCGSCRTLYVQV
jgi:hypothetical protein